MRCLFCKQEASNSLSVEHIIPESLGNRGYILPKGIVCDGCNNYFSRKVEKPFLESPGIIAMRFRERLISKKGRIPPTKGLLLSDIPVTATFDHRENITHVAVPTEHFSRLDRNGAINIALKIDGRPPDGPILSRFLAKVALEFLALRLLETPGWLDFLRENADLDLIRDHARRGSTPQWPVHVRKLYSPDARTITKDGSSVQVVHESEFLHTDLGERYLVLAIFGMEYAINLGGPSIYGYERWLKENNYASELYNAKNLLVAPFPIEPLEAGDTADDSINASQGRPS